MEQVSIIQITTATIITGFNLIMESDFFLVNLQIIKRGFCFCSFCVLGSPCQLLLLLFISLLLILVLNFSYFFQIYLFLINNVYGLYKYSGMVFRLSPKIFGFELFQVTHLWIVNKEFENGNENNSQTAYIITQNV